MANTFVHGKAGKFFVGTQEIAVEDFSLKHEVDSEDITHTQAGGAQVMLAGIERASGDVTLVFDSTNVYTVSPQSLKAGATGTLHLKPDGSLDWSFSALVTGNDWKSGPKGGVIRVKCSFKSSGSITTP